MDSQYGPRNPPYGMYHPFAQGSITPTDSFQPRLHTLQTISTDNLTSYQPEYESQPAPSVTARGAPRLNRRRQTQAGDHVKHRRTRSGCYTCRQRRVKCDETHPVCERCRKGKRECVWPESSSAKSDRGSARSKQSTEDGSGSSPSDSELELAAIADDDELDAEEETGLSSAVSEGRSRFSTIVEEKTVAEPPPSATKPPRSTSGRTSAKHSNRDDITHHPKWADLPPSVKYYLKYHRSALSFQHYAWKFDAGNFLKTTFLEIALNYEPLLYAVVAFAAYHNALSREGGKVRDFLDAYNRSVSALRQSLGRGEKHNISTLLTILQLATVEEFLGDWVNLLSHQRAAGQIITDLFTPQTITQSETHRKIITWYMRFDLFAANLGGGNTAMAREWFASCADFYKRQARDRPGDIGARIENFFGDARLIATDTSKLFVDMASQRMSHEDFTRGVDDMIKRMAIFRNTIEGAYTESTHFVRSFPDTPAYDENVDIVDARDPRFCYAGDLFAMNFVLIDYWAIHLLFYRQLRMIMPHIPEPPDLQEMAYKKCKMLEAIRYYEHSPPGAVIGCQASLGIATLHLSIDQKHINWFRRRFALIEQKGYIYPAALRQGMTKLWNTDVTRWWLDNDEGFPPVIRSLRDFIDFRANSAPGSKDADVRDMMGIFKNMTFNTEWKGDLVGESESSEPDYTMYESSPDQANG